MFPPTRYSAIQRLRSTEEPERRVAWDALVSAYWRPVYKYLRGQWRMPPDRAEDLTQDFFARAFDQGFLADYDPSKARFRTWLRLGIDRLAANDAKAAARLKRGGGARFTSLDFISAEGEVHAIDVAAATDLDAWFQQEFVRALFGRAVEALEHECRGSGREPHFALFAACDLADVETGERRSYKALADERGWTVNDVTNRLAAMRRSFRGHVLRLLRETCATDDEFETEARAVLGTHAVGCDAPSPAGRR
jgi:DNA-directed RNA polymerase specialized sigma24 family protein